MFLNEWHPAQPRNYATINYYERILHKRIDVKMTDFKSVGVGGDVPVHRIYEIR